MSDTLEIKIIKHDNIQHNTWYSRNTIENMCVSFKSHQSPNYGYFTTSPNKHLEYVNMLEVSHQIHAIYLKDPDDPWLYGSISTLDTINGRLLQSLIDRGLQIRGKLNGMLHVNTSTREAYDINYFIINVERDVDNNHWNTLSAPLGSIR